MSVEEFAFDGTWLVSLFLLVSLSLSFSLDDLKVGPQKLRLLFSFMGSAMGVTCIDDSSSGSSGSSRGIYDDECGDSKGTAKLMGGG